MKSALGVMVSTHNRKDLTAACLSVLRACLDTSVPIMVFDDYSTEYDASFLLQCGAFAVESWESHQGVGRMALARLTYFMSCVEQLEYVLLLDNDALVTPGIDQECVRIYKRLREEHGDDRPLIFSPYRSTCHGVVHWFKYHDMTVAYMKDIGGISMFMDRLTAQHLLAEIPAQAWTGPDGTVASKGGDIGWDWHVSDHALCFASRYSLVEHLGRFGNGVNGESPDKAVDFKGYRRRG